MRCRDSKVNSVVTAQNLSRVEDLSTQIVHQMPSRINKHNKQKPQKLLERKISYKGETVKLPTAHIKSNRW